MRARERWRCTIREISNNLLGMRTKVLGAFIAVRLLSLTSLALIADYRGVDFKKIFYRWDAQWYRRIAEDGYGYLATTADGRHLADYAFFPLFPFLERIVHNITSLNYIYSGVAISAISSIVAALGIYLVVEKIASSRIAFITVNLWAALPVASVQTLAYSESIFTALASWAIYLTLRRQYLGAALLASLAGATRPVGLAVAGAVMVAIFIQHRRKKFHRSAILAMIVAPLGWSGYIFWVGKQVGRWNGYFTVADGWGNNFDGGSAFMRWIADFFRDGKYLVGGALVLALIGLIILLWKLRAIKVPVVVMFFTCALVVFAFTTSGYFGSKPRYLLPAFPLLIPIAQWIQHQGVRNSRIAMMLFAVLSFIYGGFWLTGSGPL